MSDLPRISVVTPSLNQGRFIGRTVQSVLDQRGADVEFVVVDGGSTDQTLDVLRGFAGRLQWISEPDNGQAHAVNKGFSRSSGEILGWLNSDDVYFPGALSVVGRFFYEHPEVDWCYGRANHIDLEDRTIAPYPSESFQFKRLSETCFICQPAVFLRSRFVQRVGPLNEILHYSMDYDYWIRAAKLSLPSFLPEFLAGSRLYAETKSYKQRYRVHKEIAETVTRHFDRVPLSWVMGLSFFDLADRLNCPMENHYGPHWLLAFVNDGWKRVQTWVLIFFFPFVTVWHYLSLNKRGPSFDEWKHGFSRARYWMGSLWEYVKHPR